MSLSSFSHSVTSLLFLSYVDVVHLLLLAFRHIHAFIHYYTLCHICTYSLTDKHFSCARHPAVGLHRCTQFAVLSNDTTILDDTWLILACSNRCLPVGGLPWPSNIVVCVRRRKRRERADRARQKGENEE